MSYLNNGNENIFNETISSFYVNLSHETRNPLNSIIGFSQYFKSIYGNEAFEAKYFDIIINSGKKLLEVVNNLLWFIWLENNELKTSSSETSLNEGLDKVYENLYDPFYDQSEKKQVRYKTRYRLAEGEDRMFIDSFNLKEVLKRLLSNAFKNTSEGEVEMGYELKNDKKLMFYVKDTGHGIPDDKKNEIFDTTRQLREEIYDGSQGVGLGLNIAWKLVHSMGGELKFHSQVGKGSCFYFYLPFKFVRSHQFEFSSEKINKNHLVD